MSPSHYHANLLCLIFIWSLKFEILIHRFCLDWDTCHITLLGHRFYKPESLHRKWILSGQQRWQLLACRSQWCLGLRYLLMILRISVIWQCCRSHQLSGQLLCTADGWRAPPMPKGVYFLWSHYSHNVSRVFDHRSCSFDFEWGGLLSESIWNLGNAGGKVQSSKQESEVSIPCHIDNEWLMTVEMNAMSEPLCTTDVS